MTTTERNIVSPKYCYAHYFKSTHWHQYMRQTLGARAHHERMSIAIDDFMGLAFAVSKPEEHQKIVDCLYSLDDRIAVETQKLNTLKNHKKGLLQWFFPTLSEVSI